MKYYLDITLLPDAEVNLGFLWQKVYQQIHLALVEQKTTTNQSEIAVAMPEYGNKQFPLGNKLRLLAPSTGHLENLNAAKWLNRLLDYTHCTSIKSVPDTVTEFAFFKRKQFKSNIERLARRRAVRKGESLEQAMSHFIDFKEQKSKLPFIQVKSLTSGEYFKLFIERELVEQPTKVSENFNCYGLSERHEDKKVAIPNF